MSPGARRFTARSSMLFREAARRLPEIASTLIKRNPLCFLRSPSVEEAQQRAQVAACSFWRDAQLLRHGPDPVKPIGGITEPRGTGDVPSSERDKENFLPIEAQNIHTELISHPGRLIGAHTIGAEDVGEQAAQIGPHQSGLE